MIYRGYPITGETRTYTSWEIKRNGDFGEILDTTESDAWEYVVCEKDVKNACWDNIDFTETFSQAKALIDRLVKEERELKNATQTL